MLQTEQQQLVLETSNHAHCFSQHQKNTIEVECVSVVWVQQIIFIYFTLPCSMHTITVSINSSSVMNIDVTCKWWQVWLDESCGKTSGFDKMEEEEDGFCIVPGWCFISRLYNSFLDTSCLSFQIFSIFQFSFVPYFITPSHAKWRLIKSLFLPAVYCLYWFWLLNWLLTISSEVENIKGRFEKIL